MKAKNIVSVLTKKFKRWAESVEDQSVRAAVMRDGLVTGGAIVSMLLGEKPHDIDVYFKTPETAFEVAKYYVAKFKESPGVGWKNNPKCANIFAVRAGDRISIMVQSAGAAGESTREVEYDYFEATGGYEAAEFLDDTVSAAKEATEVHESDEPATEPERSKKKYRPVFLSSNAITLSDGVQVVLRFTGPVETIHENYDYVHCTCSWDAESQRLILPPAALECILAKELRYKHSKYPLCSLIRMRKFIERGWSITAGQIVKIAFELSELDLSDPTVLQDQLTGVDAAYFYEVLRLLRERMEKEGQKEIDATYLMELIDRIF